MATETPEDIESLYSVRRSERDDADQIMRMIGSEMIILKQRFGTENIGNLIEKSCLSMTATNQHGTVSGYASFSDTPPFQVPGYPRWESWLHQSFGLQSFLNVNILWLNFLVADHLHESGVINLMLKTAFITVPEVEVFLVLLPYGSPILAPYSDIFQHIPTINGEKRFEVYSISRTKYLRGVIIRRAKEEDHDDLVPVFSTQSESLRERYGEFFLANILSMETAGSGTLVAEADGKAVGLLSLTTDVNLDSLLEFFDLTQYHGFEKVENELNDFDSPRNLSRASGDAEDEGNENDESGRESGLDQGPKEEEVAWDPYQDECVVPESEMEGMDGFAGMSANRQESEMTKSESKIKVDEESESHKAAHAQGDSADGGHGAERQIDRSPKANIFCVNLFCLHEEHESRAFEFLKAAFDMFPERDYCILTLPHTTPEFPLLNYFTLVAPKQGVIAPHVLYVYHRGALISLLGHVDVREAKSSDHRAVGHLLQNSGQAEEVKNAYHSSVKGHSTMKSFVVTSGSQLLGITICQMKVDIETICSTFRIEDFLQMSEHHPEEFFEIIHWVVNPIFARTSRYILKEIMRCFQKSTVLFKVNQGSQFPPFLIPELVPVRPRRLIQGHGEDYHALDDSSFALHFFSRKMSFEPKVNSNLRIVVVGASDTGISFIESLIYLPYINYNSLTLLSDGGMMLWDETLTPMLPGSACYSRKELAQMCIESRIAVASGRLIGINRKESFIELEDGNTLPYDYLILTPGLSDPTYRNISVDPYEASGVFCVTNLSNIQPCLEYIGAEYSNFSDPVLVCGEGIEVYTIAQGLLSLGVDAKLLVLVHRSAESDPDCFMDETISKKVQESLTELGVNQFWGCDLLEIQTNDDDQVTCAVFKDGENSDRSIYCNTIICCNKQEIEDGIFHAINESCLVFDGQLVLDNLFRTNDPCIYSAGSMTNFSRRHGKSPIFRNFDSREIGTTLAKYVLGVVDPLSDFDLDIPVNRLPEFGIPKTCIAKLPGGHQFFHVQVPFGSRQAEDLERPSPITRSLSTESKDGLYCNIKINRYGFVSSITCFGKESVEISNLRCLVGLHCSYLNDLVGRYDEGIIEDIVAFLRQPWATALYHDRFWEFRSETRKSLHNIDEFGNTIQRLKDYAWRCSPGSADPKELEKFLQALTRTGRKTMNDELFKYIGQNKNHLKIYLTPENSFNGGATNTPKA